MLTDILKRSAEYKSFKEERKNGGSHAYALISDDADITYSYANLLAATLLCPTACGECRTCQKVYARCHADVKFLNGDCKMKVENSRALVGDAYKKSFEGGLKVFILLNAETLSVAVQNQLLKLTEEPPDNCVFIYVTANYGALLPTLRSRVLRLFAPALKTEDIVEVLVGDGADTAEAQLAAIEGGTLAKASKILSDSGYRDLAEAVLSTLTGCNRTSKIAEYIGKDCFSKEKLPQALDYMESLYRDTLLFITGGNPAAGREYAVRELSAGMSVAALGEVFALITETRKKLSLNVNPQTAVNGLLYGILEAKYKWR